MSRLLNRTRERPQCDREPDLSERQLNARRRVHQVMEALGGNASPAGSCVWHVVGLQRSVREWAMRQGWGGRQVRQEQAQGILIAGLGILAKHSGHEGSHTTGQKRLLIGRPSGGSSCASVAG
jgi:hypothetical protein